MNAYVWMCLGLLLVSFAYFACTLVAINRRNAPTMAEVKKASPMLDTVGTSGYRITQPTQRLQYRPVLRYAKRVDQ